MCLGNVFILLILIPINHLILALIAEEFSLDVNDLADGDTDILNNQAYVQTGSELYYFKDISYQDSVILPISSEFNKEINSDAKQKIQKNVQIFDQEITDFGTTVFGIPVQKMVNINNPSNSDVIFEAIFTIGTNFHCTFLENKTLSSNQQSSFRVYFLPLAEDAGIKEELIVLQTSIGKFIHKVRGEVTGNPYRIRSILSVNIPLNATMSAPLQLHNPHTAYMRILEIYTNDCHLQMETFDNHNIMDVPDLLFEPFETKEIAFAKILGDTERNSTTFIFIKFRLEYKNYERKIFTWNRDQTSYTLIVPLEVRVTRRRGLFSTTHVLDFNLLRAGDQAKPLKLNVFSTLERGIEVESVNVDKPKGVYLQFEQRPPIPIKPANRGQPSTSMDIASINVDTNFESKEIGEEKLEDLEKLIKREGFVIAESRGGNYNVTVPFKAIIYKGALLHNPDEVSFHKAQLPILSKIVTLTNTLPYGLIIHSVDVAKNAKNYFKTSLISSSVTLSLGQSLPVFVLHFIKRVAADFASNIFIHTNLTTFQIPLYIFQGDLKVKVHSIEKDLFQFGAIKYGEKRSIHFTLSNSNPIPLIIDKFHPPFKELSIESIDIEKLSKTNQRGLSKWKKKQKSKLYLPEYSSATFKMILSFDSSSKQISFFNGNGNETFQITSQFSTYKFPIFFKLINSSTFLTIPNKIIFKDAFIGNILTQPLMILSKFPNVLRVLRITINEEPRFSLSVSNKSLIIQPNISTKLAEITFAPEAICPQDCYLGIPLTTTDGQWFAYGMKLPQNLAEIDSYLYSRLRRKWVQMKEKIAKTTISLDADKIRGLEVPIEAHLTWPRLFSHPVVHFPLTAVGNFSIVNLTITNPSRFSVIVQILPIVIYPDAESLIELIQDELPAPLIDPIEVNETLMFSLRDTELFTLKPTSPVGIWGILIENIQVPKLREEVEKLVEGPLPRFTLSLLLRPGSSTRVRIGFLPSDYSLRSSLLVIRNNLTALEPIVLYGRGARINMEIDNKTARSQPLLFELESVHLTDCTNPRRQLHRMPTTLTVRRSFAIRNTGEVGFSVQNISINGMPCQNRGFRILNCDRFRLEPNETTYLDLAFTPDFLFSVSEATLQIYIHMNGTPWNFEMASIVPKHLLSLCHNALPRPPFEAVIYQTCVLALIFCLICIISCAYLEGDRVVMNALREQFLQEQECEVFDLNAPELTMQNRNIEKISISIQKRDFLQVSEEDGTLKKLFWRIMNFILRLFSHIWPLLRSNQKQTTKSNRSQKHSQNSVQSKNISNNNADEQLMGQSNINGIISDPKKHNNFIGTTFTSANSTTSIFWTTKKSQIIYDLNQNSLNDDSVSSSTISDDVYARSSEQQQHLILNGKRQRRKKKLDGEIDSTKNVPLFMRNNSINKQNQFVPTTESSQNGINLTTNIKDNLTKFERKNEKRAGKPTINSIEITLPFNISSSSELAPSLISSSGTQLNGNTNSIQKSSEDEIYNHATVMSRSSNSDADEKISWHNSNSLNDIEEDNFNERKELSDESDVPEWADEMIEKGNLDDEFDALAKNSAALFEDTINVNGAMTKMENKEIVNEDSEIDRVITQLTQEYRERLTKILKHDIFTLPPDLTPNIEEYFEDCLERKTIITSEVQPKSTTHKKPPGHELRKMERKKQHNQRQPVFLFNINDPIWKPIGLFDANLKEDWPDSHVKLNKSLPNNFDYNNE